jgi:hypothetical protein
VFLSRFLEWTRAHFPGYLGSSHQSHRPHAAVRIGDHAHDAHPRRRPRLGRPVAAALAVPLLSSPTGAVSVSESFTVPATGSFTIVGHGFGHGHGMSQYGANGAALRGSSTRTS